MGCFDQLGWYFFEMLSFGFGFGVSVVLMCFFLSSECCGMELINLFNNSIRNFIATEFGGECKNWGLSARMV